VTVEAPGQVLTFTPLNPALYQKESWVEVNAGSGFSISKGILAEHDRKDITQLFRIKVSLWLSCEVIPCQAKSLTTVCLKQGSHAILNTNLYTFSGLKLLRMAYPGRIQALWQLPR